MPAHAAGPVQVDRRAGLARLLRPRSIAVFGGKAAAEVVRQSAIIGFDGDVWPVHPKHETIAGVRAFRSVDDLPAAPDAAFIAVNRHLTVGILRDLARRGAGGAVAYASGFSETGAEGPALQAEIIEAAGAMPFLGPNCYGFINYLDGLLLWPDQQGGKRVDRGVALVTQSGNIAVNLTMQGRGLPVGYVITLGNQAAVGLSGMIDALVDDGRISAIGLHIEGIDDPASFARAAERARAAGIPIVALKTGRSSEGAALTISHTASLAGADAVVTAFLRRIGIVQVDSIPVLLETLKILHVVGPLPGRDVASMSCSGGEAALIADAVSRRPLRLRSLNPDQKLRVEATLPELVTVSNPLDYHTFHWGKEPELTETFSAMMAAEFDLTMLILDFPRRDRCDDVDWDPSLNALVTASRRSGRPAAVMATLGELLPEARAEAMVASGLVPLCGMEDGLDAIAAAVEAGEIGRSASRIAWQPSSAIAGNGQALAEDEAKRRLAMHGVVIPEGRRVAGAEAAVAAARDLGFPVALKALGSAIAHKTEIGAVRIGLRDDDAVRDAALFMKGLGEALLVERMVQDGLAELIVGVSRDPALGLHLVVGSGGVLVELLADSRVLMMPASREEIAGAIGSLKVARLIEGYRGKPSGDLAAAIDAVLAIQDFALAHAAGLIELDVNPLIVRPAGQGAVAVDALVRLVGQ